MRMTGTRATLSAFVAAAIMLLSGSGTSAQRATSPSPADLPNPYRLVEHWPTLPASMNDGQWGEVIRVHVDEKGNVWVFHRCFNVIPAGSATCVDRGAANPPVLEFNAAGTLLKSFGAGLFAYPHGFTVDDAGNLWATDVSDNDSRFGQQVYKLSPDGKILMTLGTRGVAAKGADGFDRPTGVAIGRNGDVFVSDGHAPNKFGTARIVKFSRDGRFVKDWGRKGSANG